MEKLIQILSRQLPHFRYIEPGCSVNDAVCRMSTHNTSYLIVLDEKGIFQGLLTEREVARKVLFMHKSLTETRVGDIMSTQMPFADINDTVEQCIQTMKRYHVQVVPVFSNRQFAGIVSAEDILEEAALHRAEIFD